MILGELVECVSKKCCHSGGPKLSEDEMKTSEATYIQAGNETCPTTSMESPESIALLSEESNGQASGPDVITEHEERAASDFA